MNNETFWIISGPFKTCSYFSSWYKMGSCKRLHWLVDHYLWSNLFLLDCLLLCPSFLLSGFFLLTEWIRADLLLGVLLYSVKAISFDTGLSLDIRTWHDTQRNIGNSGKLMQELTRSRENKLRHWDDGHPSTWTNMELARWKILWISRENQTKTASMSLAILILPY